MLNGSKNIRVFTDIENVMVQVEKIVNYSIRRENLGSGTFSIFSYVDMISHPEQAIPLEERESASKGS